MKYPHGSILWAINQPLLFKPWFKDQSTWKAWMTFLKAVFALPMTEEDLSIYRRCTKREDIPRKQFKEVAMVVGRRGGKSNIVALIAVYLACFYDWRKYLKPGDHGTVMIMASDRDQARVILRYIKGYMENIPLLAAMVKNTTKKSIELSNQIDIEIQTANYRATRGYTIVAALLDEIAFWRSDESANPDIEIVRALRPGMKTIPDSMMLLLSSPYARRGVLWDIYKESFGKSDDRVLVWQADTLTMNPSIPKRDIEIEYEKDPVAAAAEYGAQFRSDVESLIPEEVIDAAIVSQRFELPYIPENHYVAFTDTSGACQDSFTLAIAHKEKDVAVVDLIREVIPPYSPESVVKEFSNIIKKYGITVVYGDKYAGIWPREQFQKMNIRYEISDKTKSEIYLNFLPIITSNKVELLDNKKLKIQLSSLERKTRARGRDVVDHPPGAKDDIANAVAGAVVKVMPMINEWKDSNVIISDPLVSSTDEFPLPVDFSEEGEWHEELI